MTRNRPPAREPANPTQRAIRQLTPFRSRGQEAVIALLLAAEAVRNRLAALLGTRDDITLQQYNVLRILRGSGGDGLPTLAIVERMIEQTPGITRLIDRLESKRLVERHRGAGDRRQVWCRITADGLRLLAELDPPVDAFDDEVLACLGAREQTTLIELLVRLREHQAKP